MKGPSSLACTCEESSDFFNPTRCNPDAYRNTVDINPEQFVEDLRQYRVSIPPYYAFSTPICNALRFDPDYTPPFVSSRNFQIVQQGMRDTVTYGTAKAMNLPYIEVAGKTGTAEYCDDIARPLGLCERGNWPSHAWFTAYAPYENPEIIVIGFVYNGGEGSLVALPVVREVMEAYLRLKNERQGLPQPTTQEDIAPAATPTSP
jgi:membrane carboxypeptidase/penicillin-binding protein